MGLTKEQVDRMVKDANFVNGDHPYAPVLFNDLCCHVKALASEWERLTLLVIQKTKDNAELAKQIHELADTFVVGKTQCDECHGLGVVLGDGEEIPCPSCGEK